MIGSAAPPDQRRLTGSAKGGAQRAVLVIPNYDPTKLEKKLNGIASVKYAFPSLVVTSAREFIDSSFCMP